MLELNQTYRAPLPLTRKRYKWIHFVIPDQPCIKPIMGQEHRCSALITTFFIAFHTSACDGKDALQIIVSDILD